MATGRGAENLGPSHPSGPVDRRRSARWSCRCQWTWSMGLGMGSCSWAIPIDMAIPHLGEFSWYKPGDWLGLLVVIRGFRKSGIPSRQKWLSILNGRIFDEMYRYPHFKKFLHTSPRWVHLELGTGGTWGGISSHRGLNPCPGSAVERAKVWGPVVHGRTADSEFGNGLLTHCRLRLGMLQFLQNLLIRTFLWTNRHFFSQSLDLSDTPLQRRHLWQSCLRPSDSSGTPTAVWCEPLGPS